MLSFFDYFFYIFPTEHSFESEMVFLEIPFRGHTIVSVDKEV